MAERGTSIPRGLTVAGVLAAAGFEWAEPGYFSLDGGDLELALEPQVLNAGDLKLQLYRGHEPTIACDVLANVKPRPHSRPALPD